MPNHPARLLIAVALPALCLADEPATAPAVTTLTKLLTDAGRVPTVTTDAAVKEFQDKLTAKYAGQTVTYDAGTIIQIVTEGGGVKLISFPPDEANDDAKIGRGLSHATLLPEQEAAGKKLTPGDTVKLSGAVASVSVRFEETQEEKPTAHVHVTLKDAKIVGSTQVPHGKKKPATAAD